MCADRQTVESIPSRLEPFEATAGLQGSRPVGRTLRPLRIFNQRQEIEMNWDQVEGNWKQLKGNVKEQWGKLTDDQLDVIAGKRDQLAGKIQEAYGVSKEEAERQLSDWQQRQREFSRPM
jgi:uncharacterized protein YjbJ (UPF0337 family)